VEKKRLIIGKHMAGDIDNLAQTVKRLSANYRYGRDITLYALRRVIVEIIAQFPVYRTYRGPGVFSEQDREFLAAAIGKARDMVPELWYEVRLLENYLLSGPDEDVGDEARRRWLDFVMRFEQATAPLMAKGFEDTVLYVYNRLLSLNEVGGSPDRFGMSLDDFHAFNRARVERRPAGMNATSTHDTKRGEDARARLNVLSEIPREWEKQLAAWRRIGARAKRREGEAEAPDRNDEYFLYQTLIGAFPLEPGGYPEFRDRLKAFIVKAVREAKVHTAWLKPETWYEDAFLAFVDSLLPADMSGRFLKEFLPFLRRVAFYGMLNSLSQTALKLASPGVPDFYQGAEFWDLSLVDPDNRRPVDFEARRAALEALRAGAAKNLPELLAEILSGLPDGRAKLFLVARGLGLRKERPDLFRKGDYQPLQARGRHGGHVAAFARRLGNRWVIAAVPRFLTGIVKDGVLPLGRDVWGDTAVMLPGSAPSGWKNRLTDARFRAGGELMAGDIFREFPVALLCDEGDR
jgi:(1->4)-alpha-D-glucan 1-alpha-D-glucosylmutase